MTEPDQDATEPALLAALRADFAPVAQAPRERIAQHLASSVGAFALNRSLPSTRPRAPARWLGASAPSLVSSFIIGGLCGAVTYGALRPAPPPHVIYVERAAPPASPSVAPVASVASVASVAPVASGAAPRPSTPAAAEHVEPFSTANRVSAAPSASTARQTSGLAGLAEQQALIDQARAAFARSDYLATLALLRTHSQRFPKSVLGEEREALAIKALAASGQSAQARDRAARFEAQFPNSLLLPSLNDSLREIP